MIGIFLQQAAQRGHLVGVDAVIDAAGAEEQEGLEEGVRDQVEQPRHPAADAQAEHHEAELADRRVGQHLLVIGLDHRDRRGDEQGDPAGVGDVEEHVRR